MLVQAYVLTIVLIYPKTTFGLCFPLFREGVINMFKGGGAVPISHRSILKCLPPLILINHIQTPLKLFTSMAPTPTLPSLNLNLV